MKMLFCFVICVFQIIPAGAADRLAEHVVVIGLDGCRPEAIQQAAGPTLKNLMQSAAWSFKAQTALPSVTHVNFAGILTGSSPEKHGIAAKEWAEGNRLLKVKVPTIFEVVARHRGLAAGFLGHEKLYPSERPMEGAFFEHSPYESGPAARCAAEFLKEKKPAFCFIYMGDLDGAGHKYGWLSPEQLARMKGIDEAIGTVVAALRESGMWETTLLIITADHGGHGRMHSTGTPEDTTVPWIAIGPGVKAGEIKDSIHNYDTAATAAHALGMPLPVEWDGKPVSAAFTGQSK